MAAFLSKLFRPKVLIPLVLGAGILVALFAFADARKVVRLMSGFQHLSLLYFLLLILAYEVVRGAQWHFLLTALDIHVPLRTQIFVFAIGEITKLLPIGNYFQNYLLQESKGTDFGLSSAATTMVVLVEVAVSLVGVTLLGLGGWTGWLRPIIIVGTLVFAGAVWAFIRLHHAGHAPAWLTRHVWWLKVAEELRRFRGGAAAILHPRIVAIAVALGVVYLTFGGAALYIAITGLGIGGVSFGEALAVYFFSLAFSLIFPLPIDLGVAEISGAGALIAVGAEKSAAVSIVIINRILSVGSSVLIALVVALILHGEFRAAMRTTPRRLAR
ncbi:MAG TPA: lysylphosphatidylglycerol synthase transmembrane domain-containing protein [Ktedonobacterales bacterium]|jgi:uncharacterized protein (TIRG00374 family)|nr:lysylphosphatidylglycerol synthase transmembrane domain-containing protein [Ktedonobacterales bacterium]